MTRVLFEREQHPSGYRAGVFVGRPLAAFLRGLVEFPRNLYRGWRFGYPLCCVWQWCLLTLTELPQAVVNRAFIERERTNGDGYVRCASCVAAIQRADADVRVFPPCRHGH